LTKNEQNSKSKTNTSPFALAGKMTHHLLVNHASSNTPEWRHQLRHVGDFPAAGLEPQTHTAYVAWPVS